MLRSANGWWSAPRNCIHCWWRREAEKWWHDWQVCLDEILTKLTKCSNCYCQRSHKCPHHVTCKSIYIITSEMALNDLVTCKYSGSPYEGSILPNQSIIYVLVYASNYQLNWNYHCVFICLYIHNHMYYEISTYLPLSFDGGGGSLILIFGTVGLFGRFGRSECFMLRGAVTSGAFASWRVMIVASSGVGWTSATSGLTVVSPLCWIYWWLVCWSVIIKIMGSTSTNKSVNQSIEKDIKIQ